MSHMYVAKNEEAEKLLNYIIAYRNSISGFEASIPEETILDDNVSMGVIPEQMEKTPKIEFGKSKASTK